MRKINYTMLSILVIAAMLLGCNKQDWSVTVKSEVRCTTSSNETEIAGKSFVMDQVMINLAEMTITGERIQSDPIEITLYGNEDADFLSPIALHPVDIPIGTYPEMYFSSAVVSNGAPSVNITGTYYLGNGDTYDVVIALDISQDISKQIIDTDGSPTILIEESTQKNLSLTLDTDILFSDINAGLWNAAAVTNNNGAETVQVDLLNNENIYNAISAKLNDALIVQF
ncbi:MAG: hypothetical protein NXI10_09705 [bacterium]|nr:hypothetical protein [bacterium]